MNMDLLTKTDRLVLAKSIWIIQLIDCLYQLHKLEETEDLYV